MEYIILGFILFIAGVSATLIYDKAKESNLDFKKIKDSFGRTNNQVLNHNLKDVAKVLGKPKRKTKPRDLQDMNEEFLKSIDLSNMKKDFLAKCSTHVKVQSDSDSELSFSDFSTKSTITVQELIDKIESMKKPGPKK